MLVKVRKGRGVDVAMPDGTICAVMCIDPSYRFFRLVGEEYEGRLYPRRYFHEGNPDKLWLDCIDSGSGTDALRALHVGAIYPCADPAKWADGHGVVELPCRPGYFYSPSRFKVVPFPAPPDGAAGDDIEPEHKMALMAFFKKPQHDDLCRSCGAPRPCAYHG